MASGRYGNVNIGIYKGMKVAVRIMRISKFTTTRSVLLELKQMRDLTHENLIRLIGLTAEDPNVGVVMEFSPRGSLRVSSLLLIPPSLSPSLPAPFPKETSTST